MADFAVSTAFTARDKSIVSSFTRMSKGANRFGDDASRAFRQASRQGSKFQSITKGILGATAISRGIGLLSRGISSITQEFIQFDDSIVSAAAKFKDLDLSTKEGRASLEELRKAARQAGADTVFSAGQAAAALEFSARAGNTSAQAMASLRTQINLSVATNSDFARATDISTDLMGAFGLAVKDPVQNLKNLTRLNDVLAKTTNSTNVNLEDMFDTMKVAGPIARKYGASLEEVSAITGILGSAGIKGTKGATALKNVFVRLASPTSEAAKRLESLGIKTTDSVGNMKKATLLLEEIGKKIKGFGTQKQIETLDILFGKIPIAAVANLTELIPEVRNLEKALLSAGGTSKQIADIMSESLGNKLKVLRSAFIEFGFAIFTAFKKKGVGGIEGLTKAIRNFNPLPIINGIKFIVGSIETMASIISSVSPVLKVLGGAFLTYKAIVISTAIVQGIYNGALAFMTALNAARMITQTGGAMLGMIGVTKKLTVVQGLFNLVMSANPIALVIIAVGALITAGILLVKNWEKVVGFFKGVGNTIAGFFGFGEEATKTINAVKQVGNAVSDLSIGRQNAFADITTPNFLNGNNAVPERPIRIPPNRKEAEARQQFGFSGQLNIAGAPEGSTFQNNTRGIPAIDVNLLGENP